MKLNKKGYMLVEIIISFSIAMGIAYYLLNLTYKFKNTDEDIYQSTIYLKDKESVTKNIMNDLERGTVTNFPSNGELDLTSNGTKTISFNLKIDGAISRTEKRMIAVYKNNDGTTIEYGKVYYDSGPFVTTDVSYYRKTLEKSLTVKKIKHTIENNKVVTIQLEVESIYDSKNNYNINLISAYSPT